MLHLTTVGELVDAITRLAIRGAPVLGVAGALGVAMAARQAREQRWDEACLAAAVKRIADARPTAVNLRREAEATAAVIPDGAAAVEEAALATMAATVTATHRMSERGARFCGRPAGPHRCGSGPTATPGASRAWAGAPRSASSGRCTTITRCSTSWWTRPARCCREPGSPAGSSASSASSTTWSPAATPFLISQGQVDAVVVGADRIAANGDVANKMAPTASRSPPGRPGSRSWSRCRSRPSTRRPPTARGSPWNSGPKKRSPTSTVAPAGTRALNYAFDITPADLVTAVVTEDRLITS